MPNQVCCHSFSQAARPEGIIWLVRGKQFRRPFVMRTRDRRLTINTAFESSQHDSCCPDSTRLVFRYSRVMRRSGQLTPRETFVGTTFCKKSLLGVWSLLCGWLVSCGQSVRRCRKSSSPRLSVGATAGGFRWVGGYPNSTPPVVARWK